LAGDFGNSLFAAAALFHMSDRAAAENRHGAALEYLARVEKLPYRNPGILARVLFDRASIHAKLDNPRKALELLEKLLAAHAADQTAADAAELAGYLSAMLGDYVQGAAFYARAAQLRPGGVFAFGCLERRADCLFAAFFDRGGTAEQLRQAEAEYRSLLEKGRAYAPLLFKIGRCREAADDIQGALRIYSESLYRQAADRCAGVAPDPVWAPKTLYAAIHLIRGRQRSLEGARSALRLIALARQIGLPVDRGMEAIEQELQAKYKL
jgi:tetratricopeptide (TPR) repeat protein